VEASVYGVTAPSAVYEIGGRRLEIGSHGFADAVAEAHTGHRRPRCMCLAEGVEMYVARLGDGYIVKRMPGAGSHHAPDCPSYEPPAEASGLGQVQGSAISEDPATGLTTLRLDFAMSKVVGRSTMPPSTSESDSVASIGTKLSLRGLLHYLWDHAGLTRWRPGFAGKRHWGTVRRHLLQAAEHTNARGDPLRPRIYVPEMFSLDRRDAIDARRVAQWSQTIASPGKVQHLMLLVGEVKEIVPARYGFKAVVKHVPDQAFVLDEPLYRRLGRRFESELALWGTADDIRMMMIATFGVAAAGIPTIAELSLMPVTQQWLPVEDEFDRQLVARLVAEGRSFTKALRYNLSGATPLASATLTDCETGASLMFIAPAGRQDGEQSRAIGTAPSPAWIWDPATESLPPLPMRRGHRGAAPESQDQRR